MKQGIASPVKVTNQMSGMRRFGSIALSPTMKKKTKIKEVAPAPSDSEQDSKSAMLSRYVNRTFL